MNVKALVDNTSGTVVERCVYDPYGTVKFYDGSWGSASDTSAKANEILFCGYHYDPDTGLYHVRHRVYHPGLGWWLQRDPIEYGNGMGLYAYCGNNSANRLDPTGMVWKVERKGEDRAIATAGGNDTLKTLADAIKLDAKQFALWGGGEIKTEKGTTMWFVEAGGPASLSDEAINTRVCPGVEVSVPNIGYIDVATYTWGALGYGLMGLKSGVYKAWTSEGLKVVYTNTWNTTKETILEHLQSANIYKFLYIGHGAAGNMSSLKDTHDYTRKDGPGNAYWNGGKGELPGDKYTRYGIADLGVIGCETDESRDEWRKNVAPKGITRLVRGMMRSWNIKTSIVIVP
ncbi:MAG: RHS repeat-associated core domain-containing protein [Planctomycetota bacterium]|nr:RHS repeat-associated core domain-containing protein [Planctomycetota bacterium]